MLSILDFLFSVLFYDYVGIRCPFCTGKNLIGLLFWWLRILVTKYNVCTFKKMACTDRFYCKDLSGAAFLLEEASSLHLLKLFVSSCMKAVTEKSPVRTLTRRVQEFFLFSIILEQWFPDLLTSGPTAVYRDPLDQKTDLEIPYF